MSNAAETLKDRVQWGEIREKMYTLMQVPEWETYTRQMEQVELAHVERLIQADPVAHDYLRGIITGVRLAYHMPTRLVEQANKVLDKPGG